MPLQTSDATMNMVRKLKVFKGNDVLKRTALLAMSFGVVGGDTEALAAAFKRIDADSVSDMRNSCSAASPSTSPMNSSPASCGKVPLRFDLRGLLMGRDTSLA